MPVEWLLAAALGLLLGASMVALLLWRKALSQVRYWQEQTAQLQQQAQQGQQKWDELQAQSHKHALEAANWQTQSQLQQQRVIQLETQQQLQQQDAQRQQQDYARLQAQHAALQASSEEKSQHHGQLLEQLQQQKNLLAQEFENLANKIFEDKGQKFAQSHQETLGHLLTPFREQLTEFRQRVDHLNQQQQHSYTGLQLQLQQLKDLNQQMTQDAQNLTRALKGDKKLTGSWGEIQLEKSLQQAGLLAQEHYAREAVFNAADGSNKRPDFVIKLPDGKHLILDSKVSLVDYDTACSAETELAQQAALDAHCKAVKRHVDQLSERDYSNLIGIKSPSFVLMFMPIEAAYIEALKHNRDLFNYAYNKNVILVAHTTLMPILRTVANLWMIERGHRQAQDITSRAGDIYNQACLLAERFHKLGKGLNTVNNHYNDAVRALAGNQGLQGKLERFKDVASHTPRQWPTVEPQYADIEFVKLEAAMAPQALSTEETTAPD
jgi:DNA recombination protein RmuC